MPTQPLPEKPSLENLRKQAKTLRRSVLRNETGAIVRVREFHPRPDDALKKFSLSDAQLVIARGHEFASWPQLKQYLDLLDQHSFLPPASPRDDEPLADQFIRFACLDYGADHSSRRVRAHELLAENPLLLRENIHANIYLAATVGDVSAIQKLLRENPKLASLRGGPHHWEPLLYACYSRLDSSAKGHDTLAVARLLLEHGADPNDSQSLYNRMFTGGTRHLELLFEFGLGQKIDRYTAGGRKSEWRRPGNLPGMPAEMLQQQMGWAAKYNQKERMRLLVKHGVDVNTADSRLQRTPYELALLHGNTEIAEYLLAHGARQTALSDLDAFATACLRGDKARARALLARDATLIDQLGERRVELLQLAAENDKREGVWLMKELGFDLNKVKRTTALHHAASSGHLEMAQLLIELGADPLIRDTEFNATPLGWARYGEKEEVANFLKQFEQ